MKRGLQIPAHFGLRRRALAWIGAALTAPRLIASPPAHAAEPPAGSRLPAVPVAPVVPGYVMQFPRDEGSHPAFRVEWWYITGWLAAPAGAARGFQITFFRVRPRLKTETASAFNPGHLMIAHAAVADPGRGRLVHDQRAARAALDLAGATEGATRVWLDDWSLVQAGRTYRARIPARDFTLDLTFTALQPPLLQGADGLSRKSPAPASASYYYSLPHLAVEGSIILGSQTHAVSGSAWLDHEWTSNYLGEGAVGWDWIGINLDDGSALMAFRMRDAHGETYWAGGSYRNAAGSRQVFAPGEVSFAPLRRWTSPRTGATYPIAWRVTAGTLELVLEPLMDDQELDTRGTVGTVYWEGAVTASRKGVRAGRGYLELTGYWKPLEL
jgi:predicted secreted hydrolase